MSATPSISALRARKRAIEEARGAPDEGVVSRLSQVCAKGRDKAMADVLRVATSLVQFAARSAPIRASENKEATRKRVEDDTDFLVLALVELSCGDDSNADRVRANRHLVSRGDSVPPGASVLYWDEVVWAALAAAWLDLLLENVTERRVFSLTPEQHAEFYEKSVRQRMVRSKFIDECRTRNREYLMRASARCLKHVQALREAASGHLTYEAIEVIEVTARYVRGVLFFQHHTPIVEESKEVGFWEDAPLSRASDDAHIDAVLMETKSEDLVMRLRDAVVGSYALAGSFSEFERNKPQDARVCRPGAVLTRAGFNDETVVKLKADANGIVRGAPIPEAAAKRGLEFVRLALYGAAFTERTVDAREMAATAGRASMTTVADEFLGNYVLDWYGMFSRAWMRRFHAEVINGRPRLPLLWCVGSEWWVRVGGRRKDSIRIHTILGETEPYRGPDPRPRHMRWIRAPTLTAALRAWEAAAVEFYGGSLEKAREIPRLLK